MKTLEEVKNIIATKAREAKKAQEGPDVGTLVCLYYREKAFNECLELLNELPDLEAIIKEHAEIKKQSENEPNTKEIDFYGWLGDVEDKKDYDTIKNVLEEGDEQ